jgi:GT2 family glycosyltransferase
LIIWGGVIIWSWHWKDPVSEPVYILLPVHNRRAITVRMAQSLRGQTLQDFQLVLVDDGSTDGTADAVRAVLPATVVVRGNGRWWWAGCLHHASEWLAAKGVADDAMICILNDDVDIAPDFIALAVGELAARPATLLLARQAKGETRGDGGIHADLWRLHFTPEPNPVAINCLPTRGLFLRWGDLVRTGGFHPRLLPHYLSDYEFTLRAHRRGLELRVAEKAGLVPHSDQTGWSRADLFARPRGQRLAILFSRRFKENPLTRSAFVWLAVPPWQKPWVWFRVWVVFSLVLVRCLLTPISTPANSPA